MGQSRPSVIHFSAPHLDDATFSCRVAIGSFWNYVFCFFATAFIVHFHDAIATTGWFFCGRHYDCQWWVWIGAVVGHSSSPKKLQHFLDDFRVKEVRGNHGFACFVGGLSATPRSQRTIYFFTLLMKSPTSSISACYILLHILIVIWKHFGERQISA